MLNIAALGNVRIFQLVPPSIFKGANKKLTLQYQATQEF
jgi:hypothetical protein